MRLGAILRRFQGIRALVVGDVMLDEYIVGEATRVSHEAPVLVIRRHDIRIVPGGAANVAANMVSMGALVSVVGLVGEDHAGERMTSSLQHSGISHVDLIASSDRPTTRKTRVLANHSQQVVRIDHESTDPANAETEAKLVDAVAQRIEQTDIVLVSDYRKGTVTDGLLAKVLALAKDQFIPVVANAKPQGLNRYSGAQLVSLNRYEASEAIGSAEPIGDPEAERVACSLREQLDVECLLLTLGASGMVGAGKETYRVDAVRVDVYDEAGAGDTVVATVALGIAAHVFSRELLQLAAHTAAAVVQKVGVATPSAEDLERLSHL